MGALLATMFLAGLLLVVAGTVMYHIESSENEMYPNIFIAMWWAVTALTTVGYGDIYPITPMGRLLGSIVAFIGVGFFALPAGIISSGFQEVVKARKAEAHRRAATDVDLVHAGTNADLVETITRMEVQLNSLQDEVSSLGRVR